MASIAEETSFPEDSDSAVVGEAFDVEGISVEELSYWSKLAPEDQKLNGSDEGSSEEPMLSSKSLDSVGS